MEKKVTPAQRKRIGQELSANRRDAAELRRRKPLGHRMPMSELMPLITRLREGRFRDGSRYRGQTEGPYAGRAMKDDD